MNIRFTLFVLVGIFLLTGCGPTPAEIEAANAGAKRHAEEVKKQEEIEATARLEAFWAASKKKRDLEAKALEEAKARAPIMELMRIREERLRVERAIQAHTREYVRKGNELADRDGQ